MTDSVRLTDEYPIQGDVSTDRRFGRPGTPQSMERALLGSQIRNLRTARGLNQRSVAAEAGCTFQYVSDVENGQANVTIGVLDAIAASVGGLLVCEVLPLASAATGDQAGTRSLIAGQSAARQALILEGLAALAELDDMKLPLLVGILQQQAKPAAVSEPEGHYVVGQRKGG